MQHGIFEIDQQVSIIINVVHLPHHSYELGSTIHVITCAIQINITCAIQIKDHKNRDCLPLLVGYIYI